MLGVPETRDREGDHRAPTGSSPSSTTPTPTRATTTAEERFKEISAAYDVLGDAEKRKEYDEVRQHRSGRASGPAAVGSGAGGGLGGQAFHVRRSTASAASATSSATCSAVGGAARRGAAAAPARSAAHDLETELHLDVRRRGPRRHHARCTSRADAPCSTCHGTGAAPGTSPETLPAVRRPRRRSTTTRACSRSRRSCPTCGGRGHGHRRPVPDLSRHAASSVRAARGEGAHPGRRRRRPAHPAEGPRRRRAATAARPATSTSSCTSTPHPLFGRSGNDLTLDVPVTFAEAALGADVKVPTLDGGPVTLQGPARHAERASTCRVQGPGRPERQRRRGDLLVTVEVAVPAELTDERAQGGRGAGRGDRRVAARPPGGVMAA